MGHGDRFGLAHPVRTVAPVLRGPSQHLGGAGRDAPQRDHRDLPGPGAAARTARAAASGVMAGQSRLRAVLLLALIAAALGGALLGRRSTSFSTAPSQAAPDVLRLGHVTL